MKKLNQLINDATRSLLGRFRKVTTIGCMLALVVLVATIAQAKTSGTARPFKANGIVTVNTGSSMEVVGTATHLGEFVADAKWVYDPETSALHVSASWTAANGDTLQAEFPAWGITSDSGVATITGGTGRFANATGSYVATFSGANLEIFTVDGTISY